MTHLFMLIITSGKLLSQAGSNLIIFIVSCTLGSRVQYVGVGGFMNYPITEKYSFTRTN